MTDHADTIRVDRAWLDALLAERQQLEEAIQELREANDAVLAYRMRVGSVSDAEELIEQRQQAIDALREAMEVEFSAEFSFQRHCKMQQIVRQALDALGEKP